MSRAPEAQLRTAPHRPRRRDPVALALVVGFVVASLFLAGVAVYVQNIFGGNCTDWWVYCPIGPSAQTPLGTAIAFGNVSSETVPAAGPAEPGCHVPASGVEYCEILPVMLVASDIGSNSVEFELKNSSGVAVPYTTVTLLDSEGEGIEYGTVSGGWQACTPAACGTASSGSTHSLPAPLTPGESFVVDAGPSSSFPDGLRSWGLEAIGVGAFSGTVGPIALT